MPSKFKPTRERKHKKIARSKTDGKQSEPVVDSNAIELIPTAKADIEEKKRRLKEELRNEGTQVSGKKAKRLEKYIETKLKKDENRELIKKLAGSRVDTSLYSSSKKLGQGKPTKREQLRQALRHHQAGIDVDGKNEELLFEERKVQDTPVSATGPLTEVIQQVSTSLPMVAIGSGLKRPLDKDESGNPILKKRQKRGGVKSKISLQKNVEEEPAWKGFDSDSGSEEIPTRDEESEDSESGSENDSKDEDEEAMSEAGSISDVDMDYSSGEENASGSNEQSKQQRSSAFKAWATQQRNEALGYQPTSNIETVIEAQKIASFTPRAKEEDPLPEELQPSLFANQDRKAFSVLVNRTPEIEGSRLKLPIVVEEQKIMQAIHNNTTVVVYGATGSGKTTQVPQFLYEAGYGSPTSPTPGMIGVTQPRRVAAVSMAKRVADELGNHGKRVAYQIRFEGNVGADTAIKFMTDGVLLREVAQDVALRKYSAIVIDEAHERSVNTDILIGMLSRVVKLREEMRAEDPAVTPLKLVIMSATLRITDFTENKTLFPVPPPVLQAEGRQYTVTNHFSRKTHHDYLEDAFHKISKGHRKLPPGGMLVFLTGQNEITALMKRLRAAFPTAKGHTPAGPKVRVSAKDAAIEAEDIDLGEAMVAGDDGGDETDESVDRELEDDNEFNIDEGDESATGPAKIHVLPLYSLLPTREQLRVFEPPPDGSRLIILATNIAETSLTIPGIRYVFDCGRSKERKYDPLTGVQSFEIGWISKASASQRAGRAGRTGPGHCYKLYSSAVYERDFEGFAKPEILRMPIEGVVLQLKAMNLQHVVNFPFPTPPERQMLASSEKLLTYLSAIKSTGEITEMGTTMSLFPLSPRFARVLLIGHLHDCLPYTIALVAGLSTAEVLVPENQAVRAIATREEDVVLTQANRIEEDERNKERRKFNKVQKDFCSLDDKSDAIKLLQVVGEFAHNPTEAWCQHHFVRFKVLKEISQLRRHITDLLRLNIPAFASLTFQEKLPKPSPKQVKALKQIIAAGFIDHVAIRADKSPNPPAGVRRNPSRAIDVPYLTLFPSHLQNKDEDKAVYLHPASPLAHLSPQECPEYVIYSYLQVSAVNPAKPEKSPRTRMHALTDITGNQLAALAKDTPLLHYGKPLKDVMPKFTAAGDGKGETRECYVIPYLRAESVGGTGWPLPARKVIQKKIPGKGWVVD